MLVVPLPLFNIVFRCIASLCGTLLLVVDHGTKNVHDRINYLLASSLVFTDRTKLISRPPSSHMDTLSLFFFFGLINP